VFDHLRDKKVVGVFVRFFRAPLHPFKNTACNCVIVNTKWLVDYSQNYDEIVSDFNAFSSKLDTKMCNSFPISALVIMVNRVRI
jgi:hypothetical protein